MEARPVTEFDPAAAGARVKRIALACAAVVVAVNIWTGAPLLALWIGSRFVGSTRLNMGAVGIVVVALAVCVYSLVVLLSRIDAAYVRLLAPAGPGHRVTAPWLRSMRAERDDLVAQEHGFNVIERIAVLSVGACALTFNVWFFFFAGSPI